MLVFQVIGRIGSNNVSAPLGGRRLPAIFPKRCNAGGQAGSSGQGLPGAVAWGLAVPVGEAWEIGTPGALPSPGVLQAVPSWWPWRLHFVPTARGYGRSWVLPTFCPYGAWAVVWNCKTEKCTHTGLAALRKCKTEKCKSGERCRWCSLGASVAGR
jgi:hypothetical protein